jgi:hypothetical protein
LGARPDAGPTGQQGCRRSVSIAPTASGTWSELPHLKITVRLDERKAQRHVVDQALVNEIVSDRRRRDRLSRIKYLGQPKAENLLHDYRPQRMWDAAAFRLKLADAASMQIRANRPARVYRQDLLRADVRMQVAIAFGCLAFTVFLPAYFRDGYYRAGFRVTISTIVRSPLTR